MNPDPTFVTHISSNPQLAGMMMGAFTADALCLGAHWIYDQAEIAAKFGHPTALHAPASQYHAGKSAGDYTHIGDQMWILQQSLVATGGTLDANDFITRWREFWQAPSTKSYRDKATAQTLQNLERGHAIHEAGSLSEELAGPARSIPVIASGLVLNLSESALIEAAQEQTALTHRSVPALHTAAFLARLFLGLAADLDLATALDGALGDSSQIVRDHGLRAESSRLAKLSTLEAVAQLGMACDLNQGFPSALVILSRHGHSYEEAMVQNFLAGGDSAARGIIIGAVLGYVHGLDAIPSAWRQGLHNLPF